MKFLNNIGLGEIMQSAEVLYGFLDMVVSDPSRTTRACSGTYLTKTLGDAEFILHTAPRTDAEGLEECGFSAFVQKTATVRLNIAAEGVLAEEGDDPLSRCVFFRTPQTGLSLPVRLIRGDVRPDWREGDEVEMRMAFFPEAVSCFEDEETWSASRRTAIGAGSILAGGGSDESWLKAKVIEITVGRTRTPDGAAIPFLIVICDTCLGELPLVFRAEDVEPADLNILRRPGCIIEATGVLAGDCAAGGYANGAVMDNDHALRFLRECMDMGEPARLAGLMDQSCVGTVDGVEASGRLDVLGRILALYEELGREGKVGASFCTLAVPQADGGEAELYSVALTVDGQMRRLFLTEFTEEGSFCNIVVRS